MKNFKKLFKQKKPIIGMIHVGALPGTPAFKGSMTRIIVKACTEAEIYSKSGVDGIIIENMHDTPFMKGDVGHEITSAMTILAHEVKSASRLPCGIQILAGANKASLAVAQAAGAEFIRAEAFIFAHIADEGLIEASAGELLRYRKQIGAEEILIFADIKKKHSSHSITSDIPIEETAMAAEFFRADGVIVTGIKTGSPAVPDELKLVRKSVGLPVLVGSGITKENVADFIHAADGLIVGSYFKKRGKWNFAVDYDVTADFMEHVNILRSS